MIQRADEQRNEEDDAGIGHRHGVITWCEEKWSHSWAGRTVRASDEKGCIHIYDGIYEKSRREGRTRGRGEEEWLDI